MTTNIKIDTNPTAGFDTLVNLLAVYTEATNRLNEIQVQANDSQMETLDEHRKDYANYQRALADSEKAIKELAQQHPEWLEDRSIKTPYGNVRFTRATSLEIENPELTIRLIRFRLPDADQYIRKIEEPDKDMLARLTDEHLNNLGINRLTVDSIKVTPAKVDMGKAAKKSKEEAKG